MRRKESIGELMENWELRKLRELREVREYWGVKEVLGELRKYWGVKGVKRVLGS